MRVKFRVASKGQISMPRLPNSLESHKIKGLNSEMASEIELVPDYGAKVGVDRSPN